MSGSRRNERASKGSRSSAGRIHAQSARREQHDAPTPAKALSANQLMTAGQLAERWQVPKGQVYRLTRDGQIPVVRLGRYFRYRLDAIEAWEEAE